jgi:hypothetical protein
MVKIVGKTRLKRSLETHSQAEAERRKHAVVAEFLAMIEAARAGRLPKAVVTGIAAVPSMSSKELTSLALDLRASLQSQEGDSEAVELETEGIYQVADKIRGQEVGVDEDTDSPIFDRQSEEKAGQFLRVALGKETPVREPLDLFHAQVKWYATYQKRQQQSDHGTGGLVQGRSCAVRDRGHYSEKSGPIHRRPRGQH